MPSAPPSSTRPSTTVTGAVHGPSSAGPQSRPPGIGADPIDRSPPARGIERVTRPRPGSRAPARRVSPASAGGNGPGMVGPRASGSYPRRARRGARSRARRLLRADATRGPPCRPWRSPGTAESTVARTIVPASAGPRESARRRSFGASERCRPWDRARRVATLGLGHHTPPTSASGAPTDPVCARQSRRPSSRPARTPCPRAGSWPHTRCRPTTSTPPPISPPSREDHWVCRWPGPRRRPSGRRCPRRSSRPPRPCGR